MASGGTLGRGTAGTAPDGSWSLNPTGPSVSFTSPVNGASNVTTSATITIIWTAPDGIDPWSLSVTIAGAAAVEGGSFYSGSYAGSIVVDQNTATITISTHPAFGAMVTVNTSATDLEANTQSYSFSFTTTSLLVLTDSVTLSDALVADYGAIGTLSDSATISDSLVSQSAHKPDATDTVTISDSTSSQSNENLSISTTVSVTDSVFVDHPQSTNVSDSITLTDAVAEHIGVHDHLTDSVTISNAVAPVWAFRPDVSDTVTITDRVGTANVYNQGLSDTITLADQATGVRQDPPSQGRQVGNTGNTPAGETGYPVGSRGDAYQSAGSLPGAAVQPSQAREVTQPSQSLPEAAVQPSQAREAVNEVSTPGSDEGLSLSPRTQLADGTFLHHYIENLADPLTITDASLASEGFPVGANETVGVVETLTYRYDGRPFGLSEMITVLGTATEGEANPVLVAETVGIAEALHLGFHANLHETVLIQETVFAGSGKVVSEDTILIVTFAIGLRVEGSTVPTHYNFTEESGAFPITILGIEPVTATLATGVRATVLNTGSPSSFSISFADGTFSDINVGDYIFLNSASNKVDYLRIVSVVGSNIVVVDKPILAYDTENGMIPWRHTTPLSGVIITTTKQTNNTTYDYFFHGLLTVLGTPYTNAGTFVAQAIKPQVLSVEQLSEGQLLVTFSENMLDDGFLTSPAEYTVTGPSRVRVEEVQTPAPNQVILVTNGLGVGSYTLTVNATGTPHDLAGNPIDPIFNEAVFTGSIPLTACSIFTDMGPISKAPNVIQTGVRATVVDSVTLNLADGNLTPTSIGLLITLSGGTKNGGTFLIKSVPLATQVKVVASFTIPDATIMSWEVFDPRDGEIADDPSDVTVTINGTPTPALDVIGLLGQIVLAAPPQDGDRVLVDYNWVLNPVIDLRRLNSKEFRLNSWNRDLGYIPDASRHKYRFNNTLPVPNTYILPTPVMSGTGAEITTASDFTLPGATLTNTDVDLTVRIGGVNGGDYIIAAVIDATHITVSTPVQIFPDPSSGTLSWEVFDPDNLDERAPLAQPLLRGLKYRAYERAYTALLNDPNTLLFNSPVHKIAFPPLQRPLVSIFVNYQATGLPQNDPVAPWTLHGTGTANIVNDELVVTSSSAGPPFPTGQPIFWTQAIDLTFPNVFASSWRLTVNSDSSPEGVFTGVCSGFSDGERCCVVGFLDVAGTQMIGILKAGAGNDPSQLSAWIGGLDALGNATNAPVAFEWDTLHSYRLFQDQTGNVSVFVDGGVVATLLVAEANLPFLSELNEPFNQLQGIFFGALSRLAVSTSTWDFLRYQILPINPQQVAPSVFVSYEGTTPPEDASQPWTPLGAHGTETIPHPGLLILDSTSATDQATEVISGLIDGDFRGFDRIEPLLSAASSIALDVNIQVLTWTNGISPNAIMVGIDDSSYLIQLCFFPSQGTSLYSYGGRSFPDQFEPYTWTKMGGQTPTLIGQYLEISDASTTDGLLYVIDDNPTPSGPNRVVSQLNDYILEFRTKVISHTPDPGGFSGVNAEVYDSFRDLGVVLLDLAGTLYVALHSEGSVIVEQFPFNWNDGNFHTYRMVKSTSGNLVTLFIDTVLIGTAPYSSFSTPAPSPIGVVSFGSTTPLSTMSLSVVQWAYCNVWRVNPVSHQYIGLWKGFDPNALTGYHLPLKTTGTNARVVGNGIEDLNADFVAAGVISGDVFIVDVGPNKGVYEITSVSHTVLTVAIQTNPPTIAASAQMAGSSTFEGMGTVAELAAASLHGSASMGATAILFPNASATPPHLGATSAIGGHASIIGETSVTDRARTNIVGGSAFEATATVSGLPFSPSPFPVQPSRVNYRIPYDVDWTVPHNYRIVRDPGGGVAVFVDNTVSPVIDIGYNNIDLPSSAVGLPDAINGGLPGVLWGAFDPTNLSQTAWQYVRYGITRPVGEALIVPPHQVLNQRNIMQSYERHLTNIPHTLTDFWSESEGITSQTTDPTFLDLPSVSAYTQLNELTPLVPSTQTYEVRRPTPVLVPVVGFNNIQDLLNSQAFVMNESEQRIELIVPPGVLYNSLQVIENDTGVPNLIAPFNDEGQPYSLGTFSFQNTVCLTYDAQTLPEQDPTAITPWTYEAVEPANVNRTVQSGILTYGTNSTGTQTAYINMTPLPDCPSLTTQVTFTIKLLNDASGGLGDSQVRFGLSAPGMTASLAFVTMPTGKRYVLIIDQNSGTVVGGIPFDFLDGNFHTYRMVRNPTGLPPGPPMMGHPMLGPPPMPGVLQVFIDS